MARLIRERDGEGYHGSRVETVDPVTKQFESFNGNPSTLIGKMLLVGTVTAGSFSERDWWRTNVIKEIISESENEIKFTTDSGSVYTLIK